MRLLAVLFLGDVLPVELCDVNGVAATRRFGRVVSERGEGIARVVLRRACVPAAFRTASARLSPGQFTPRPCNCSFGMLNTEAVRRIC